MLTRKITMMAAALCVAGAAQADQPAAIADLTGKDGQSAGRVEIYDTDNGLLFRVSASGLSSGWHGFHVHETGDCGNDFKAAGGHYAPEGSAHGYMSENGAHAGDLPNIWADESGEAHADIHSAVLGMMDGSAPLMDADGSAIMIHAEGDNYQDVDSAGGRVACGVIEAAG